MDKAKLAKLEAAGWTQVTVHEFLKLSDEEARFMEIRSRVSEALKERRASLSLTQAAVAQRLKSSQSRVAKMEAADSSVSLDLMIQSLLKLGASVESIAAVIAPKPEGTSTAVVRIVTEVPTVDSPIPYSQGIKNNYTTPKKAFCPWKSPSANTVPA